MRLNQLPGSDLAQAVSQSHALPVTDPATPKQKTPLALPVAKAPPTSASASANTPVDNVALNQSVAAINRYIQQHQPAIGNIEFSVDADSGRTLTKVVDKDTNTVLLQIPSKEALAISASIGKQKGVLIRATA